MGLWSWLGLPLDSVGRVGFEVVAPCCKIPHLVAIPAAHDGNLSIASVGASASPSHCANIALSVPIGCYRALALSPRPSPDGLAGIMCFQRPASRAAMEEPVGAKSLGRSRGDAIRWSSNQRATADLNAKRLPHRLRKPSSRTRQFSLTHTAGPDTATWCNGGTEP